MLLAGHILQRHLVMPLIPLNDLLMNNHLLDDDILRLFPESIIDRHHHHNILYVVLQQREDNHLFMHKNHIRHIHHHHTPEELEDRVTLKNADPVDKSQFAILPLSLTVLTHLVIHMNMAEEEVITNHITHTWNTPQITEDYPNKNPESRLHI